MRKKLMATLCTLGTLCLAAGIGLSVQGNVAADSVAPTVTLKEGASARLHATEYGIRFTGVIENYDAVYSYGMYIFPADYLDDYETGSVVEHAQSKLGEGKTLAGGDCTPYLNGSTYQINGALVGLNYNNLNREFVAIAYTKDTNGVCEYSEVSVERNIVWVAGAALDDTTKTYNETQTGILNDFIKLGYYQAIGTEEEVAKAATELPAIEVGGTTEVYNGLWAKPAPTFTYGGEAITNDFNPYASEVSTGLSYQQQNVRSLIIGSYTLGYADITGTHGVTIRTMDETPNEAYFGICETVTKDTAIANADSPLTVECAEDSEVMLIRGENARGFVAGTDYTVTNTGISIAGTKVNYYGGPSDLFVVEGNTATVYRVAHISDFFDPTITASKFTYIGAGLGRGNTDGKLWLASKWGNDLTGRGYAYGMDIEYLELAAAEGYYALEFDVTVDDTFAAYTNKGIRVYSSTDISAGDVGAIQGGTEGVSIYQDFGTDVTAATTFTVKVVLEDFLAMNEEANQFRFVLGGAKNNYVYFTDFRLRKTATADELAEDLEAKYGFSATTSYSTASGGIWDVNAGGTTAKSWDATANAMKIVMANANSGLDGRDFVTYTDISILKEAQAAGFTTMTFKVSSPDGAFTEAERTVGTATVQNGIRVYSKKTAGRNGDAGGIRDTDAARSYGTYIYKDFGTGGGVTEFTVTIDIEEFLALNAEANYFAFVFSAPNGTSADFSDLNFFTVAE